MKQILLVASLFFISTKMQAQNLHLTIFAGTSNYNGDLQDKAFTFSQSHFAGGFGAIYDINDHLAARAGVTFGSISANDKYGKNSLRNLNFASNITEVNAGVEYYITKIGDHFLTPYFFGGIALYHFNPYTFDTSGTKYFLKPLSTEGEGFIAGKNNYNLTQLAIPLGVGVKLSLSDNVNVGLEVGYRKLFTDYLDDVSGKYVDEATLIAAKGAKAAELAYRGDELKNGSAYPPAGTIRGGSTHKDSYYFTGLTASFRLFSGNGLGSGLGTHRSKYGCPANVQ